MADLGKYVETLCNVIVQDSIYMGTNYTQPIFEYIDMAMTCVRATQARVRAAGLCAIGYLLYTRAVFNVRERYDEFMAILWDVREIIGEDMRVPTDEYVLVEWMPCVYNALYLDMDFWLTNFVLCVVSKLNVAVPFAWPSTAGPCPRFRHEWMLRALERKPDLSAAYIFLAKEIFYQPKGATISLFLTSSPEPTLYTVPDLLVHAIDVNPLDATAYAKLACCMVLHLDRYSTAGPDVVSMKLINGRTMTIFELCLEALRLDPHSGDAYGSLFEALVRRPVLYEAQMLPICGCTLADEPHVCLPKERRVSLGQIGMRALQYGMIRLLEVNVTMALRYTRMFEGGWVPHMHAAFSSIQTSTPTFLKKQASGASLDELFSTLLMGFGRLEERGVLPLSHHSMLEDMMGAWTLQDRIARYPGDRAERLLP